MIALAECYPVKTKTRVSDNINDKVLYTIFYQHFYV